MIDPEHVRQAHADELHHALINACDTIIRFSQFTFPGSAPSQVEQQFEVVSTELLKSIVEHLATIGAHEVEVVQVDTGAEIPETRQISGFTADIDRFTSSFLFETEPGPTDVYDIKRFIVLPTPALTRNKQKPLNPQRVSREILPHTPVRCSVYL